MPVDLPELYFRLKDNGAAVFRVDPENRQKRIDLDQIANVNLRNGEIKAQGKSVVTAEEHAVIEAWLAERRALQAARELDDIHRTIDQLNLTAHWAQTRATPEELDAVTDKLLLAMFDLRQVLVRKKADRLTGRD
jgi:predicted HD phosphohydrolase